MLSFRNIFKQRDLNLLWIGQIASQSGDSIYQIGLLWLALEISGSEAVTGLVAMSSYLPAILLSIFAGVAADRFNRRKIMIIADAWRTIVVLMIPVVFYIGFLNPVLLAINAFCLAIAAAFFNPARDSIIPQIVPKSSLVQANSLIQTSWQFALLLGPAAAGFLLNVFGKIHLFSVNAFFYLFSLILILAIRPAPNPSSVQKKGIGWGEIKQGLQYVLGNKVLLPLILITVADNLFIMGPAIVGTPVFVKEILHKDVQTYALIQACYAIGMLIGTSALLTAGNRFSKGKILLTGMILDGITFIPLYWADTVISTSVIIVIHSLAIPLLTVSRASIIQDLVPQELTGRIFALINMSVVGMSAISAGLSGVILEFISPQTLFLIIGIGGGICGVIGWIYAGELRAKA